MRGVYVRRQGRITKGQARALETLSKNYLVTGLEDREAATMVEVGFGMGQALIEFARNHPSWRCVGIDVYRPGIGALMANAEKLQLGNIRIVEDDAREVFRTAPAAIVDVVAVFFPDPWPKKRHRKRRLVAPEFAADVARCLRPGGRLLLATDWRDYAEQMLAVLDANPDFVNEAGPRQFAKRAAERPLTNFEARGIRLGHDVWDLAYTRRSDANSLKIDPPLALD